MNDEIKEILDDLDYAKNKQRGTITLNQKDIDLLLDYITNLQEELEEEKRINQEDLKYIDELNERIEKAVEYIKEDMYSEPNELYGLVHGYHLLDILNGKE